MSVYNIILDKYRRLPVQAKASFWFLICSVLQKGISTIFTPIFTRILSTSEYGQYNVFNSWLDIISIIVTFNLFAGVYTQGLVKFDKEKELFTSSLQGLNLILCIGWAIIYFFNHSFFNKVFQTTTVQMFCMFVIIWSTACFNFWATSQRVEYKYKSLVILTLIVSFLKPFLGIILVLNSTDKVTARILGIAIVDFFCYAHLFIRQIGTEHKPYFNQYWIYAIQFNLPLILHYLSQTVLNSSDRIMIRSLIGQDKAGIYSLAYSIALLMTLFNNALSQTITPWIYQKIKKNDIKNIGEIAYHTLIMLASLNLLFMAFAPEVVRIFAPKSYYEAIWIIPPVSMSVLFIYSYDLFAKFEFYFEKTKFIMVASVAGASFNILLNYIFISKYGYIAAGYTTLVCYIIYALAHYIFMNKICDQFLDGQRPYSTRTILFIFSFFLMAGFIILFLYNYTYIRYAVIIICFFIISSKGKRIKNDIESLLQIRKNK